MWDYFSFFFKLYAFIKEQEHHQKTEEIYERLDDVSSDIKICKDNSTQTMADHKDLKVAIELIQAPMKSFVAALVLVGGWDGKNRSDIAVLEFLTEKPYNNDFKNQLLSLINDNDKSVLQQENEVYTIKKRIMVLNEVGKWIYPDMLSNFGILFERLFDKNCPEFSSSEFLKSHLTKALVLLSKSGKVLTQCSNKRIENVIKQCIKNCFQNKTAYEKATLLRYSEEFAKADPDTFFEIITKGIKDNIFKDMFQDEYLYSTSVEPLLFSLENLMFIPQYQLKVCNVLAMLSELDPGGKRYPRALSQLAHIFSNHSLIQIESRKQKHLLQYIKKKYPLVFWKMIDDVFQDVFPNEFQRLKSPKLESSFNIEDSYCEMLIEMLKSDISNVNILTKYLPNLSEKGEEQFLDFLKSDFFKKQSEEIREPVWETLYFHVLLHDDESFTYKVRKWKEVLGTILLSTPHIKYRYLYNQDNAFLLEDQASIDESVEKKRIQALEVILDEEGLKGFWEFVTHIQLYWFASLLICETDKVEIVEKDVFARKTFASDEEKVRRFSASFLFCRANRNGSDWIDEHFDSDWDENTRLNYLLPLPFNNNTWDRVSLWLQNPEEYWEQVNFPIIDMTQKNPNTAIQELIKCNRIHEAVIYTACNLEGDQKIDISVCTTLLETFLNSSNEVKDSYHVQKIISYLRKKNICHEQILALEMKLLQKKGLSYPVRPMEIWKELRSSPEYFCYFIKLVQDSNLPFMVTCQMEKSLKQWNLLPGKNEDGFNFDEFKSWFEKVKAISKGTSYELKAMEVIGRHLAEIKPPESEDSFWLLPEIAELLNRKENEALLSGLKLYLYDPKEVHCINEEYIQKSQQDLDKKAEQAEKLGYLRIADAVRDVRRKYLD